MFKENKVESIMQGISVNNRGIKDVTETVKQEYEKLKGTSIPCYVFMKDCIIFDFEVLKDKVNLYNLQNLYADNLRGYLIEDSAKVSDIISNNELDMMLYDMYLEKRGIKNTTDSLGDYIVRNNRLFEYYYNKELEKSDYIINEIVSEDNSITVDVDVSDIDVNELDMEKVWSKFVADDKTLNFYRVGAGTIISQDCFSNLVNIEVREQLVKKENKSVIIDKLELRNFHLGYMCSFLSYALLEGYSVQLDVNGFIQIKD